jgi:hypothetical protein
VVVLVVVVVLSAKRGAAACLPCSVAHARGDEKPATRVRAAWEARRTIMPERIEGLIVDRGTC